MHSIASASLLGLAAFSAVVSAVPIVQRDWYSGSSSTSAAPAAGTPFSLPNGFPNITNPSQQLTQIELQAHGTLPNAPPPASVSADTLTSLRLIAFNEIFEVAFFSSLLANVTNHVPGYEVPAHEYAPLVNALTAVVAQEELHTLNANGALKHFGAQPIEACQYQFPVSDLKSAVGLASTFTNVVLGTLQDVQSLLATDGDAGLIRGVGSVIGQEGEQNGFYRALLGKIPSALPFLTTATREFAFSALNQNFVVPGSCPNINTIALPIFAPLTILTQNIAPQTQTLQFSFPAPDSSYYQGAGLSVVYINQQNLPVVEPLQSVSASGNIVTFSANFPFNQFEMNGLTLAAVVKGSGPFANADLVAQAAIAGPGLIEIN